MRARCSQCLTEGRISVVQPSEFGGWQDYELYCETCKAYEPIAYVSRDNKLVEIPIESRRIAGSRPMGSA